LHDDRPCREQIKGLANAAIIPSYCCSYYEQLTYCMAAFRMSSQWVDVIIYHCLGRGEEGKPLVG
jgi:hypothetical protein